MIIAVDGPAASGKGTLARRLAVHYQLAHLDTGLLYRATAFELLSNGIPLYDAERAVIAARGLALIEFDNEVLRAHELSEAASIIAAIPAVRATLLQSQRDFATRPGGAILDGRDIGTVIYPQADVKLFVTASPAARAMRRVKELMQRGERPDPDKILNDILKRDARDASRDMAPLAPADDAVILDTSDLDIEATVAAAIKIIEGRTTNRPFI